MSILRHNFPRKPHKTDITFVHKASGGKAQVLIWSEGMVKCGEKRKRRVFSINGVDKVANKDGVCSFVVKVGDYECEATIKTWEERNVLIVKDRAFRLQFNTTIL